MLCLSLQNNVLVLNIFLCRRWKDLSRLIAAFVLRVLCLGLLVGGRGAASPSSKDDVARPPMLLWGRLVPYSEMEAGEGEI